MPNEAQFDDPAITQPRIPVHLERFSFDYFSHSNAARGFVWLVKAKCDPEQRLPHPRHAKYFGEFVAGLPNGVSSFAATNGAISCS